MTGHGQPGQTRHRPATDQEAHAALFGEANHLLEPLKNLTFDVDRRVVATRTTWIHGRGQGFCEHADDSRGRVDPSEEPGMPVPERERRHLLDELIEKRVHILPCSRERAVRETVDQVAWAWPEHRAVRQ